MGQYWIPVNLTKKEFINPHKLGAGLKITEQLGTHPGTGAALIVLLTKQPEQRGGGDFDIDANWHGPERTFPEHNLSPGPMPDGFLIFDQETKAVKKSCMYPDIARRIIGRWAGDQVVIVGDYSEDSDMPNSPFPLSKVYHMCSPKSHEVHNDIAENAVYKDTNGKYVHFVEDEPAEFKDISAEVCIIIEHELLGKFTGDGWRDFEYNDKTED